METKISDYVSKRDELAAPPEDIPNEIFLQSRGIVLASTSSSNEDTLLSGKQRVESEMKNESEGKDGAVENSRSLELASTSSSTAAAEEKNFNVKIEKNKKRSARSGYSSLPWKNVEK